MKGLIDLLLVARALRLAHRAQRVRRVSLAEAVRGVAGRGGGSGYSIERIDLAAARAVSRWKRWFGGIDTCLTRSLVLGGMLAGRGDVRLNVGFRPGEEESALHGHAWVTVDGRAVGGDGGLAEERYTRVLTVQFVRGTEKE